MCSKLSMKVMTFSGVRSFSYLHQVSKHPLKYLTLGQFFEKSAKTFHDRDVVISMDQNKSFTYGEALEKVDRLAAGLLHIGLEKGDRIGIWCPNLSEWFLSMFACARAGLILVALNPNYQATEIEYSVSKVGVKCLICPDKVNKMNFLEILNTMMDFENNEVGKLKSKILPSLKSVITISDNELRGTYNFEEISQCSDKSLIKKIKENQNRISPDDAFSILFSSGTTGQPKAAVVSHFSHVNNSISIGRRMELDTKHHRICMMNPFFHAYGFDITTFSAVNYGSTIVIPSIVYNSSKNLTAVKEQKCTILHGTPTMHLDLLLEQKKRNEDIAPEIALSGGSPISSKQLEIMLRDLKLRTVKSIYGLTETTAMVFISNPGDDDEKSISTVGLLGDHIEAKVIDRNGQIVPFGTTGELCVRGYMTMMKYWGDDEKTQAVLGKDGWFKTGDLFILSEDGYGKIVGRIKDMLIRGGENIYPKEIEDYLINHPHIVEVHVVGIPHERLGEEVCACVRLQENSSLTLQDVKDFCKGKIAHFKIPSILKIVDSFEKTSSGKVKKYKLVEKFAKKN